MSSREAPASTSALRRKLQWPLVGAPPCPISLADRPRVAGKFIYASDAKLYIKGVTYGAFKPDSEGREYSDLEQIDADFGLMAAFGINTVRIPHTTPPRVLLDIAHSHGLRVMVGLSAEQFVGYLLDGRAVPGLEVEIDAKVRQVAGHPALLCYALGNEIPASIARWLGRHRIERYLGEIYQRIKAIDPDGIVTYVNYPSTEYLDLPFLDALSFNVYLESPQSLRAYLARLQNLAGDRPLLMTELGLDAMRNGEDRQAEALDWQVRTTFAAGCAGAILFSWTDEWHRAGAEVEDWAFGLTDKKRRPKPALMAVRAAFDDVPLSPSADRPRFSIIICTYNGAKTLTDAWRRCRESTIRIMK